MPDALRILIIDDEPMLAEGIKQLLELDGLVVHVEPSLITLPFIFRRFDPDLVLLDLSMPALGADAYFAARGKQSESFSPPAVLYSGRSRRELTRLAEQLGADGCISKEEDLTDIVRRIHAHAAHGRALKTIARRTDATARAASLAANEPQYAERDRDRVA